MQSRSANQGEASFYNVANSTVCTEQWWKGTGYNSFSHALTRGIASNSSSLDDQSQSEGVMNEEDEDTVKQSKGDVAIKTLGSTVPLQPGSDRIDHLEGTSLLHNGPTLQPRPCENLTQPAQLELVSHSIAFASSKYDPYYGGMVAAAAAYGQPVVPHLYDMHHVRMPLPLEVAQEPVYVNAKQYHGILRRRQSRAKATLEKKLITSRKPYLHESRHQHAMRRARSSGGRFAKKSDPEATSKGTGSSSSLSSQSTNSSQSLFPNSASPEVQNLYNGDVDSYRKQANLQVESVYHTHAGKNREGFSSSQQWGNITSNRALAMQ